jgi:hypothetical protein
LNDVVKPDGLGKFLQRDLVEIMPGLAGIGLDLIEGYPQHIGHGFYYGGLEFPGSSFEIGVDALQ